MTDPLTPSPPPTAQDEGVSLPPGAPHWVTPELFTDTAATWQPIYGRRLTPEEVLGILLSVGRLLDCLEHTDDEAVRGTG